MVSLRGMIPWLVASWQGYMQVQGVTMRKRHRFWCMCPHCIGVETPQFYERARTLTQIRRHVIYHLMAWQTWSGGRAYPCAHSRHSSLSSSRPWTQNSDISSMKSTTSERAFFLYQQYVVIQHLTLSAWHIAYPKASWYAPIVVHKQGHGDSILSGWARLHVVCVLGNLYPTR